MAEFVNGKYVAPSGKVYYESEEKKKAQQYAQKALEGTGPVKYISPSQVHNAVINAGIPIIEGEYPGGGSSENSAMNRYLAELERQQRERQKMLDEQYKQGKRNINDAAEQGNKEAYIAFMQGMKNMPQKVAIYGAGGMAQSLANKSQLNYENNRNNIERTRLSALRDLEADYRAGVMDAGENYLTRLSAAQDKISAATTKGTGAKGGQGTTKGYSIAGHQTVHSGDDEQVMTGLVNELMNMGYTRQQAEEYIRGQM